MFFFSFKLTFIFMCSNVIIRTTLFVKEMITCIFAKGQFSVQWGTHFIATLLKATTKDAE